MFQRLQQEARALFLEEEHAEGAILPPFRRFLRFWILVGRGFARNRCPIRASALAYSSLLAFVPLLAVVIGVSTGVLKSDEKKIRGWIDDVVVRVAPQLQNSREFGMTLDNLVDSITGMIDNVHSGTLGTTGVIALLAMILFMLARIEETLNDMWGISQGRSWYKRMVNYWAAISLGPIVMIGAIGFTTSLRLETVQLWLERLPFIGSWLIKMLPIPILSAVCAVFYLLMPNTKVQWRAAMVGGLVAGILWHVNTTLSVMFASQLARDSAIYGSLAAVPVFMVGLFFFWLLLLFGAQVSYTFQNRRSFLAVRQTERVNQEGREFVALRIMIEATRAFMEGAPPPGVDGVAERLEVPGQLISQVAGLLSHHGLLVEVSRGEPGFVPARPPSQIKVADVLQAMRRGTGNRPATSLGSGRKIAEEALDRVAGAELEAGSQTLEELMARAPREA